MILDMAEGIDGSKTPAQIAKHTTMVDLGGQCLKQPALYWAAKYKYTKLKEIKLEVTNFSLSSVRQKDYQ